LIEKVWVWTADHSEDGEAPLQIISTGRGILVESTKATWLVGSGSEHHWLFGYNFNNAQNVYAGLLQVESPYMQGRGVQNSQNIYLYSSSTWAFFDGEWDGQYGQQFQCSPDCQANMNRVAGSVSAVNWYGVNTKAGKTMILDGKLNPQMLNNPGSWGGNLVAYRQFA
jgi:glucan 1,3-beta-glucosidase